jgi:hypothetical protein
MIRGIASNFAVAAFVLLLPFFSFAAWRWGSPDEQWLLKAAFYALSPLCAAMWYGLISGRRFSYLVQILLIVLGYVGVYWRIKVRTVTF